MNETPKNGISATGVPTRRWSKTVWFYVKKARLYYAADNYGTMHNLRSVTIQKCALMSLHKAYNEAGGGRDSWMQTRYLREETRKLFDEMCAQNVNKYAMVGLGVDALFNSKETHWMFDSKKRLGVINKDELNNCTKLMWPLFVNRKSTRMNSKKNVDDLWKINKKGIELMEYYKYKEEQKKMER